VGRLTRSLRIAAGITGREPRGSRLRAAVAGRTVLVTGASEGIGAATARRLGAAGATVLLVARTVERLEEVRADIVAAGGTAHVHPADLSSPEAAAALGRDLLTRYRRIDVVVSNAGRSIRRSVADTADRFHDIERTINLNYLGPVQLLLVLIPAMRTGGGHIVNVSTAGLSTVAPLWSAYLGSKAAFDTWLRSAAPELRSDRVTVSTVYCNLVRTRMSAPTAHYARMPAMSADEAAAIVCRSVAYRRSWWPWWARVGSVVAAALPGTVQRAMAAGLRLVGAVAPLRALGGVGLWRPRRLLRLARAGRRYGRNLAAALAGGPPGGLALIDEQGPLRYPELRALAAAGAAGARETLGVRAGDRVAVLCGGHRGFVAAAAGVAALGADVVLLPGDLPADRLDAVLRREGITAAIHDGDGFAGDVPALPWSALVKAAPVKAAPVKAAPVKAGGEPRTGPRRHGRLVITTSGTTGVPRSVARPLPLRILLGPVSTHLGLIPLHAGEPIVVATPPHHGYGLTYLAAGLVLGTPVVLVAGADPAAILRAVAEHRGALLFALPIQLRRICDLPAAERDRWPVGSLRAVISGAAPLTPALCDRVRGVFGDKIFNLYGTSEAGWAAIATPADLRAAPGTVGRAPRGVRLRIVDGDGAPLPPGQIGEVHVQGWLPDGSWLATGDLGHLDPVGRLFLDGRIDDMIVSGGENVYPGPVADVLLAHPDVADALLEAVPDAEFGQRLRAVVEVRPGGSLTEDALRAWLRSRLSRAERPRDIVLVDALARTSTGKPMRGGRS
jgi:acyl-CoA synthetase (AMP-forming)/AMP-acid ligase II/short-subunit dehydrogenase